MMGLCVSHELSMDMVNHKLMTIDCLLQLWQYRIVGHHIYDTHSLHIPDIIQMSKWCFGFALVIRLYVIWCTTWNIWWWWIMVTMISVSHHMGEWYTETAFIIIILIYQTRTNTVWFKYILFQKKNGLGMAKVQV